MPPVSEADMKRREFLGVLGGAAVAWPRAATAQQPEKMRTIGMLVAGTADRPEHQARVGALLQALQQLGWVDGRNVRIDIRWATADAAALRKHAAELAALAPDVIVSATGTSTAGPLLEATRAVPIVFALVIDPVGAGFVASLARPGGNATGFMYFEYGLSGKWLELLKQIVPGITRVSVVRDPAIASGIGQFGAMQSAAPSLGLEVIPINLRDASEVERDIAAAARFPNSGLIVTAAPRTLLFRDLIIGLAAKHRLPAVYSSRDWITAGGLMSYGPDILDQYRRAAGY